MNWSGEIFRRTIGQLSRVDSWVKLRQAFSERWQIGNALLPRRAVTLPLRLEDRVLIVGVGISGLTVAKELASLGFRNVQILSRDGRFGGKCVHWGCMPSEFSFADPKAKAKGRKEFVGRLEKLAEQQFQALGYEIVRGELKAIRDSIAHLSSGEEISFDRLVLCTGNKVVPPHFLSPNISLQEFWDLNPGKLVLVSDGTPTSLSLASLATELGHSVTLLFLKSPALSHLPSFRYYQRQVERQGVEIKVVQSLEQKEGELKANVQGKSLVFKFDTFLYDGSPKPMLPMIDGKMPSFYALDLSLGSFPARPDITCVGDAAGFLSATEAEVHAMSVIQTWRGGQTLRMKDIENLPVRFHAKTSFAMVGAPWTLTCHEWREVDFGVLGWEKIYQSPGKLWYLFNRDTQRVDAIHLCHAKAGELISVASAMMEHPISDLRWQTLSVHPDSSEIFKVMAQEIQRGLPNRRPLPAILEEKEILLRLPSDADLQHLCPDWLSDEEWRRGLLSSRPHFYYAFYLGMKKGLNQTKSAISLPIPSQGDIGDVSYFFDEEKGILDLRGPNRRVRVLRS